MTPEAEASAEMMTESAAIPVDAVTGEAIVQSEQLLDATVPVDTAVQSESDLGQAPAPYDPRNDATADLRTSLPRMKVVIESILFVSDRPVGVEHIQTLLELSDGTQIREALAQLVVESAERGIVLHEVAGGYQLRTNPRSAQWVQRAIAARPIKLSKPQLETLAIVAYRQPITRPEIDEIRGVDSGGVLKVLMERNLIKILGKKEEPGRPMLYGTTKDFLEFFNLKDLRDLPTLREFHELSPEHQLKVDAIGEPEGKEGEEVVPSVVAAESETDATHVRGAASELDVSGESASESSEQNDGSGQSESSEGNT